MTRVSPRTLSLWLVLLGPELAQRAACGLAPPNWPQECTDPTYSWLRNSAGQSACGVLSQLSIPCLSSIVTYKPLPATSCLCNTVIYSFVYACGLCTGQSRLETTFGGYSGELDCEGTVTSQYPGRIPGGVIIPGWAYLPLAANNSFDIAKAQEAAGGQPFSNNVPQQLSHSATPTPAPATPPDAGPDSHADDAASCTSPAPSASTPSPTRIASEVSTNPVPQASGVASALYDSHESSATGTHPPNLLSASSSFWAGPSFSAPDEVSAAILNSYGPGTPTTVADRPTSLPAGGQQHRRLGAVIGGVIGGITAAILATAIAVLATRRWRRRRAKQIVFMQMTLDWKKHREAPDTFVSPTEPEPSECSTVGSYDAESDWATLPCGDASEEKKSVTYGNYPDI